MYGNSKGVIQSTMTMSKERFELKRLAKSLRAKDTEIFAILESNELKELKEEM